MAQTHYLEHTYQSDSCKKKGCRRWPRQTFADFPFAETHSGHLSLVAFRSCRGNSPSISIPRNSPAPSFWGLAHLSSIEYALPAPSSPEPRPTMMYPVPQFSGPGPACTLRAPICPPSAPLLAPAVAEEKETANLWAPAGEGGA